MKVKFNTTQDASQFVNTCSKFSQVDVSMSSGSTTVDGKSLMGILGFGLGKVLDCDLITQDVEAEKLLTTMLGKFTAED